MDNDAMYENIIAQLRRINDTLDRLTDIVDKVTWNMGHQ